MTGQQQALTHNPDRSGLWRKILNPDRTVHDGAWRAAWAAAELVGTCRDCGDYLRPGQPYKVGATWWYPAACRRDEDCRYETAHHGPRPAEKKTNWRPA